MCEIPSAMKPFSDREEKLLPHKIRAQVKWLGRVGYEECWEVQKDFAKKRAGVEIFDTLLFVEHNPVITLGAGFHQENLLLPSEEYAKRGIEIIRTDRGGDITYHGPDQLVIYPIFDIREHSKDVHEWLRLLEEAVIRTVQRFGIEAHRYPGYTGVWVGQKKIASIGIKVSRWINIHGIALNCNNDMTPFSWIVPCGIVGHPMTSLKLETGRDVTIHEAMREATAAFEEVFHLEFYS